MVSVQYSCSWIINPRQIPRNKPWFRTVWYTQEQTKYSLNCKITRASRIKIETWDDIIMYTPPAKNMNGIQIIWYLYMSIDKWNKILKLEGNLSCLSSLLSSP